MAFTSITVLLKGELGPVACPPVRPREEWQVLAPAETLQRLCAIARRAEAVQAPWQVGMAYQCLSMFSCFLKKTVNKTPVFFCQFIKFI